MDQHVYNFLQAFSFDYRIFFPPTFPWTFQSFEITTVFTKGSGRRGQTTLTGYMFSHSSSLCSQLNASLFFLSDWHSWHFRPSLLFWNVILWQCTSRRNTPGGEPKELQRGVCPWLCLMITRARTSALRCCSLTWRAQGLHVGRQSSSSQLCTVKQVLCEWIPRR